MSHVYICSTQYVLGNIIYILSSQFIPQQIIGKIILTITYTYYTYYTYYTLV